MGIFDFLKRNKKEKKIEPVIVQSQPVAPEKVKPTLKPVPISALELKEAKWADFGADLKTAGLLPNSYDRTPAEIKVFWNKENQPGVELLFKSKTSKSERKIVLTEDSAQEIVNNGAPKANDLIMSEWRNAQRSIRFHRQYKIRDEIFMHKQMGEALKRRGAEQAELAEKYLKIADLFVAEREFVEKHKNDVYEFFGYIGMHEGERPFFVVYDKKDEGICSGNMVHAFSPRTLEFCVARLVEEEKFVEAGTDEDLEFFREKCQDVARDSIYQSTDWNHTIDMLCDMLKQKAEQSQNQEESAKEEQTAEALERI